MKVFIDANVWISAHVGSGLCMELIIFVRQRHQLVTSRQALHEFERATQGKLRIDPATVAHWRANIETHCVVVPDPRRVPARTRDPKDDPILQAALDADCEWLVSGDKDLTSLKRVQRMPISTPRDFLEALGVEEPWD